MDIHIAEITDKKTWDTFISRHGTWSLFQSFSWGEVCQALAQKIVRVGIYDHELLVGIAQVLIVKARRGTFLHVRQGPVIVSSSSEQEKAYWQGLLSFLRQLAALEKAWFIRVSPMTADTEEQKNLLSSLSMRPAPIHAMDGEICWVLDLNVSEELLLANMRKSTRYLIRQAEKMGVEIKEEHKIDAFMDLYASTAQRQGFVSHRGLREEFEIFAREHKTLLLLAHHEKQLVAGALILFFGSQAIYHHGASVPSKTGAAHLLQWRAIQEAKKRGASLYNFWGIAPSESERHPWKGLTVFKQGFGGREMRFIHTHDLPVSPLYLLPYTIETVRKLKRGY